MSLIATSCILSAPNDSTAQTLKVGVSVSKSYVDISRMIEYNNYEDADQRLKEILSKNPNVFIEIDNEHNIIKGKTPCDYGFEYFSIMSNGKVEFVHDIYDKVHGLNKIMEHYTSNVKNEFKNEVLNKVVLLKITCNNLSAKICRG